MMRQISERRPLRSALVGVSVISALLAVTGCAAVDNGAVRPSPDAVAIARGRTIAELRCSVCHATGASGDSRSLMAPPFRTIHMNYNRLAFTKRMDELAGDGGHNMPGYDLRREEFDDLVAYLESERRGSGRG